MTRYVTTVVSCLLLVGCPEGKPPTKTASIVQPAAGNVDAARDLGVSAEAAPTPQGSDFGAKCPLERKDLCVALRANIDAYRHHFDPLRCEGTRSKIVPKGFGYCEFGTWQAGDPSGRAVDCVAEGEPLDCPKAIAQIPSVAQQVDPCFGADWTRGPHRWSRPELSPTSDTIDDSVAALTCSIALVAVAPPPGSTTATHCRLDVRCQPTDSFDPTAPY